MKAKKTKAQKLADGMALPKPPPQEEVKPEEAERFETAATPEVTRSRRNRKIPAAELERLLFTTRYPPEK